MDYAYTHAWRNSYYTKVTSLAEFKFWMRLEKGMNPFVILPSLYKIEEHTDPLYNTKSKRRKASVWFYGISSIVGYLMLNPLYTYILNIWFGLVGFYGISTIVSYLMLNPLYIYIYIYIYIYKIWFDLVGFYGISTIVGYLMLNPLYTYVLNIYDLVWLGFMAYQPL